MNDPFILDDPKTLSRLDSVACILEWTRLMPSSDRTQFLKALIECSDSAQEVVTSQLQVVKNPDATLAERNHALTTITEALFSNCEKMKSQEETFAERLKELMAGKQISQKELADRMGCTQPAISQMLRRQCRPQKKTILGLAEALNVHPRELWPDLEVAEMLDAVASFQQDDYTMTEAEVKALDQSATKNKPKIRAKSLPTRP